eukprot:5051528-Pleurochrysis_carterae.AAC.1
MAYGRMDDSPTEYKPRSEQTAICSAILCEVVTIVSGCTVFDYAFHNVYCAALFRCGCTFPWAGGASGCNIHNVHGPRCPWCNVLNSNLFLLAPLITDHFTVLLMCCAYYVARYRSLSFEKRLAIAAATFLGWGFIMGALFYLLTDYPCFLWINNDGKGCALNRFKELHARAVAQTSVRLRCVMLDSLEIAGLWVWKLACSFPHSFPWPSTALGWSRRCSWSLSAVNLLLCATSSISHSVVDVKCEKRNVKKRKTNVQKENNTFSKEAPR